MEHIQYSDLRRSLAKTMDDVVENREPLVVTRRGNAHVVMLSLDEYRSLTETAYLLRSPKNALRILQSMEELANRKGMKKSLEELESLTNPDV